MAHLVAVLIGLICALPMTSAAAFVPPTSTTKPAAGAKAQKQVSAPARPGKVPAASDEFVITVASDVKLNGRPCQFKDVPSHAVITEIEVDADTNEVYKIHFSTQK